MFLDFAKFFQLFGLFNDLLRDNFSLYLVSQVSKTKKHDVSKVIQTSWLTYPLMVQISFLPSIQMHLTFNFS